MDNNVEDEVIEEEQEQKPTEPTEEVETVTEEEYDFDEDKYQEELDDSSSSGFSLNDGNKKLIRKLGLIMGAIIALFVVIGLIMGLVSLFKGHSYTYEEVEDIMKDAAVSYFKEHKKKLPTKKQVVEITDSTLIKHEYMDELDKYLGEDSNCSGKVSVKKIDGKYVYTPYLNCGSDYNTTELYSLLKEKIVTTGEGLYSVDNSYIYRGEKLRNYVKLGKKLWRAVKINSNDEVMLILDSYSGYADIWDDRYNIATEYNAGMNNYKLSRMRDRLNKIYKDNDSSTRILRAQDKAKLTTFDLCIAKRHKFSTDKKNTEECKEILSNQKIGLLTVSDYIFASLDPNCKKDLDESCQNYNYLAKADDWALVTGVVNDNNKVFYVKGGDVDTQEAAGYYEARPVVMLNNMAMVKKGKGTRNKPYVIK